MGGAQVEDVRVIRWRMWAMEVTRLYTEDTRLTSRLDICREILMTVIISVDDTHQAVGCDGEDTESLSVGVRRIVISTAANQPQTYTA